MIDLAPQHLETIQRILREHVPACEVRAFGSRVNGTTKSYSDLDLAVVGSGRLADDTLRRLKEAFEESDLPSAWTCSTGTPPPPVFKRSSRNSMRPFQGSSD